MKTCTLCHRSLDESNFYQRTNRKCLYAYCKKCFSRYSYEKHIRKKLKAIEFLGGKCNVCERVLSDENPYYLFDFHHIDPTTKDCEWTKMRWKTWTTLVKELEKCQCVCAICHRKLEYHENRLKMEGC